MKDDELLEEIRLRRSIQNHSPEGSPVWDDCEVRLQILYDKAAKRGLEVPSEPTQVEIVQGLTYRVVGKGQAKGLRDPLKTDSFIEARDYALKWSNEAKDILKRDVPVVLTPTKD